MRAAKKKKVPWASVTLRMLIKARTPGSRLCNPAPHSVLLLQTLSLFTAVKPQTWPFLSKKPKPFFHVKALQLPRRKPSVYVTQSHADAAFVSCLVRGMRLAVPLCLRVHPAEPRGIAVLMSARPFRNVLRRKVHSHARQRGFRHALLGKTAKNLGYQRLYDTNVSPHSQQNGGSRPPSLTLFQT